MSIQYVQIYYGPCDSFYTVEHKPQKLWGMRDRLRKLGYRVDLIPVEFINCCVLEMCGHEVFRCNIQNLQFNTPYYRDPVCQRAVHAVTESTTKFVRARLYLWLSQYIDELIFKRNETYSLKDHWPFEYNLKPFGSVLDCAKCCGIKVTKKKTEHVD